MMSTPELHAESADFRVLIDSKSLQRRVDEMATELMDGEPPLLVAVLQGALPFAEALCQRLQRTPGDFATIALSSYGAGTVSSGRIEIVQDLDVDPAGRRLAILEDIVDTGRTVHWLRAHLLERGARSVEVHTLLSKPSRRVIDVPLEGVGFEIPDEFVIGFGMDVAGRFRELPHIAVYDEVVDQAAQKRLRGA